MRKQKLKAQKALIKAIDSIPRAKGAKQAKLTDTQDSADLLLDAEAKLGAMLADIPDKKATSGAGSRSLPPQITHKESHQAQTIASPAAF